MTKNKTSFVSGSNRVKLYGLFGYPLAHTLSPAMHEAAFQSHGLKAYYLALELAPPDFRKAMRGLSSKRFALEGFNVTVPHKETVLPYLDRLTEEAKIIGAVNTVFRRGTKWVGTNTDVYGFLTSLRKEGKFDPRGKKALIFGAGGASRAVVGGLAKEASRAITLLDLDRPRAQKIIRHYKRLFPKIDWAVIPAEDGRAVQAALAAADLVVNASTVGLKNAAATLYPDPFVPKAVAGRRKLFFDLIYHHPDTAFMRVARRRGHRAMSGLGMLLHQGARAWECWTGRKAPVAVMRKALVEALHP